MYCAIPSDRVSIEDLKSVRYDPFLNVKVVNSLPMRGGRQQLSSGVQSDASARKDMKALETAPYLSDLSSTHTVQGTGQARASGCEAVLRRKRAQVDIIGHRWQHPVELNNVLRAGSHGSGERTFRVHRKQVHPSPGSPRARGPPFHDCHVQTVCATPRSW